MKDDTTDHKAKHVAVLRKMRASEWEGNRVNTAALDAAIAAMTAAADSEGEDEAVLWVSPEDFRNPHFVGMNAVRASHEQHGKHGKHYTMPLYTRLAAQAAATPKHDEGLVKCYHCGAPCREEVLMRGGDNGWGDDASRTVRRYAPPPALATQPAARRVTDAERLLTNLVDDVFGLINESSGVYGLHLNGDPSPWEELLPGSRFERFSTLNDALKLVESFAQPVEGVSGG